MYLALQKSKTLRNPLDMDSERAT